MTAFGVFVGGGSEKATLIYQVTTTFAEAGTAQEEVTINLFPTLRIN